MKKLLLIFILNLILINFLYAESLPDYVYHEEQNTHLLPELTAENGYYPEVTITKIPPPTFWEYIAGATWN